MEVCTMSTVNQVISVFRDFLTVVHVENSKRKGENIEHRQQLAGSMVVITFNYSCLVV